MFTEPDPAADGRAIDIHALLDPLVDGGLLARSACDEVCKEVEALLAVIEGPLVGDSFWAAFQQEFGFGAVPVADRHTPMNAANLCPEPTRLLRAANLLRTAYNQDVAQQTRMYRGTEGGIRVRQLENARAVLAQGLGLSAADRDNLAIVRNASEANNAVNAGYRRWRRDREGNPLDNVVLWTENHPTNLAAWRMRAEFGGKPDLFEIRPVTFDYRAKPEAIAEAFTSRIDASTRFVSYSETANGSGFRMPEAAIAAIWKHVVGNGLDCHVHIDGTMAWGARPIDLGKPQCHSFVSSAHKWFLGPKETGILYMDPARAEKLMPSIYAYDYAIRIENDWAKMPKTALRFELLGQRDDVNIIVLACTQLMWTALQARKPYQRVAELGTLLREMLARQGWEPVTPEEPDRRWGIVRVKAPRGGRAKSLYHWIYDDPGYRFAGSGDDAEFRLCPHIYNTVPDVVRVVAGMNEWRREE